MKQLSMPLNLQPSLQLALDAPLQRDALKNHVETSMQVTHLEDLQQRWQ